MNIPSYLKRGDTIAICCPAKSLPGEITTAISLLESWGLNVVLGETVTARYHQFAGDDELRRKDLQTFLDDPSVRAIIAARGGYGTLRIIDSLDFREFSKRPKWIVGFSDITVLHSHLHAVLNTASIHGQMPLNIPDATLPSLESLKSLLFAEPMNYHFPVQGGVQGKATGELIGGNLTLLMMMNGSPSEMDYKGKILFIEDVGEYYYSIDRMMRSLDRTGKLAGLSGLIVGGFTGMKDNDIAFGETVKDILLNVAGKYKYPIAFDFPAGHIDNNYALKLGATVSMEVTQQGMILTEI